MFSCDRAALLRVSAAPAMTSGTRGPRLATIRPASGAHRAMTTGIGKMDRPACSADRPRTSCRYKVDRNRNPAIAAIDRGIAPKGPELLQKPAGAFLLQEGRRGDAAKLQVDLVDPLLLAREKLQAFADSRVPGKFV